MQPAQQQHYASSLPGHLLDDGLKIKANIKYQLIKIWTELRNFNIRVLSWGLSFHQHLHALCYIQS
jgi:hypothetical protein